MFAAIVSLTIDPAKAAAAAGAFTAEVLPRVRAAPGFVAGYWLEPKSGEGLGFLLFETAEQAADACPPGVSWDAPGVQVGLAEIRRVAVAVTGDSR